MHAHDIYTRDQKGTRFGTKTENLVVVKRFAHLSVWCSWGVRIKTHQHDFAPGASGGCLGTSDYQRKVVS